MPKTQNPDKPEPSTPKIRPVMFHWSYHLRRGGGISLGFRFQFPNIDTFADHTTRRFANLTISFLVLSIGIDFIGKPLDPFANALGFQA